MNFFKEAEEILNNYPKLVTALSNLKKRKVRLLQKNAPSSVISAGLLKLSTDSVHVTDTIGEMVELANTVANISITENKVEEIEMLISKLSKEERNIIKFWYFEKLSKDEILIKLNMTNKSSLYKKRNKAVGDFAVFYYGAAALNWFLEEKTHNNL